MKSPFFLGVVYIFICVNLFSCAHTKQLETEKVYNQRKIRSLEGDLKKKQLAIENLKEQNWILKQKYMADSRMPTQKIPVPFQPSAGMIQSDETLKPSVALSTTPQISQGAQLPSSLAANGAVINTAEVNSPKLEEAIATDSHESAEHNLYAKVIASYRQKKLSDLKRVTEILLKTYPQSVFADRAIFLNARLDFENANDQSALNACEKIIRDYPNANKIVSSYFLKAQILKKQGRIFEAKSVLADVQNYFPGSPEAYRVPLELKLISLQAKAAK